MKNMCVWGGLSMWSGRGELSTNFCCCDMPSIKNAKQIDSCVKGAWGESETVRPNLSARQHTIVCGGGGMVKGWAMPGGHGLLRRFRSHNPSVLSPQP